MLMKKILSLLLILAMLTVAMVSCKKDEPTETPVTPNPPVQETRYTITAEEWETFCTMRNYTMTSDTNYTQTYGDQTMSRRAIVVAKSSETAMYFSATTEMTGQDAPTTESHYAVLVDGVVYNLEMDGDEVTDVIIDNDDTIPTFEVYMDIEDVAFTDLVYDPETKGYTFVETSGGNEIPYTVWFENGKIVKIVATMTSESTVNTPDGPIIITQVIEINVVISGIGTTTVTVPDFEKPQA